MVVRFLEVIAVEYDGAKDFIYRVNFLPRVQQIGKHVLFKIDGFLYLKILFDKLTLLVEKLEIQAENLRQLFYVFEPQSLCTFALATLKLGHVLGLKVPLQTTFD